MIGVVDVRKFWLYVYNTKVAKGWDWVKLPDGRVVKVTPGKYVKVFSEKPLVFGFEDLTEEIGQKPDYDYDEPRVKVVSESGLFVKVVELECYFGGAYDGALYYGNVKVYDTKEHGKDKVRVRFSYVDWGNIALAILSASVIGLGALTLRK